MDEYVRSANNYAIKQVIKDSIDFDCEIILQLLKARKIDDLENFLTLRLGCKFEPRIIK